MAKLADGICQFHHAIKGIVRAADVEDGHEVRMATRDRFILLQAGKLALEWTRVTEVVAANDFDGAQRAEPCVPCKPHFAVSAPADAAEKFVVRDRHRRGPLPPARIVS